MYLHAYIHLQLNCSHVLGLDMLLQVQSCDEHHF